MSDMDKGGEDSVCTTVTGGDPPWPPVTQSGPSAIVFLTRPI